MRELSFRLNGTPTRLSVDESRTLLWVLRDDLGLTGTKYGCGMAQCGSCTVVVDNEAVRACATRMGDVQGASILTIEGLASNGRLHPVQAAFVRHAAYQCGFCTPGMIMAAFALLKAHPAASADQIVRGLDGNLCRCGSYPRIVEAVESVSAEPKGAAR